MRIELSEKIAGFGPIEFDIGELLQKNGPALNEDS
jgi:hypothetical protein